MTMRWMEGFEARLNNTLQAETYGQDGTGGYGGATLAEEGQPGRKIGTALGGSEFTQFTSPTLVPSPTNTWIICFAWRKGNKSNIAGTPGFRLFREASGQQLELRIVDGTRTGTWAIEVLRGASSLGQTQDYAWGGERTWMNFQVAVVINTGTGGSVNIKAFDYNNNATTDLNLTSIDTADQGVAGMDQVQFLPASELDAFQVVDDIVIMDDAGSQNNAQTAVPFLIYGQLPITDQTVEWDVSTGSNHAAVLDDPAISAGDGEEVTSDTVTNLDQFLMQTVPEMSDAGTPTIVAIMVDIHGAMKNSGTRTVRVNIDDPVGSDADVATDLIWSDLSLTARTLVIEDNPVSAAAWTLADLEDHYFGFKLHA